jgi:hypothetical protein
MAPANPWAMNCAMTWWLASGRSGLVDRAMNARPLKVGEVAYQRLVHSAARWIAQACWYTPR